MSRWLGPEAAEGATQQVFLNAWASRQHYDPDRAPMIAWLMVIARHERDRRLVKRSRRSAAEVSWLNSLVSDEINEMELAVEVDLRTRVAKLGDSDRDLMNRRFREGQTFAEIGAALHILPDAARKRLKRLIDDFQQTFSNKS